MLWREVLVAYLAPAVSAGLGGLLTGRTELVWAALTSIGGTSAIVALLLGSWLRSRADRWPRLRRLPPPALAAGFGLAAAALGELLAQLLCRAAGFPDRLRIDVPIAAAVAAAIIVWRWRALTPRHAGAAARP
ncbi:conserved hypothetical protein [Nocardia seriolae]|nr:conserved hypothetical protein [Nocardia seriolae]